MQNVTVVIMGLGNYLNGAKNQSSINLVSELSDAGVDVLHIDDFEKMRSVQGDNILSKTAKYLFVEVVDAQSDGAIVTAHVRPTRYLNMRTAFDIVEQSFGAYRRYDATFASAFDMVRDITRLRDAYQLALSAVGASYEMVMSDASAEVVVQHNLSAQVKLSITDFFTNQPVTSYTVTEGSPDSITVQFSEPRIVRIKAEAVAGWKI